MKEIMSRNEAFCENCRKRVGFSIKGVEQIADLGVEIVRYPGKDCYCNECGNPVFVDWIDDENRASFSAVFRQKHSIISLEDILKIPEIYNIGKRPLSLLLGWGELTYSRYADGQMPSVKYSNVLKELLRNPVAYSSLLERNKDMISDVTYRKTRAACDRCLFKELQMNKILSVAEYLILSAKDITRLSLQKALYYAQGFSYALTGTFMFENDCEAWVNGPVYEVVYRSARYDSLIERLSEGDEYTSTSLTALTAQDKEILDAVVSSFLKYSGGVLKMFTHSETPWILARNGAPDGEKTRNIITKDSIKEYFSRVADEYGITKPSEIRKYSDAMFTKMFPVNND